MTDVTGVGNEGWLRCAPAPHCRCWAMGDLQENAQLFQGAGKGREGDKERHTPMQRGPNFSFPWLLPPTPIKNCIDSSLPLGWAEQPLRGYCSGCADEREDLSQPELEEHKCWS